MDAHNDWSVQWNEATRTPHRAYGTSIAIPGFSFITKENVEEAARKFLLMNTSLLKVSQSEITLSRAEVHNNVWYVSFLQKKNDIPVLVTDIELRLHTNGNVMMFGSDASPEIHLNTIPSIAKEKAQRNARNGLEESFIVNATAPKLFILPVRNASSVDFHLVYETQIRTANPDALWMTYVDAHSGAIVWRWNKLRNIIEGKVKAEVQLREPTDTFAVRPLAHQYVKKEQHKLPQMTTAHLFLMAAEQ